MCNTNCTNFFILSVMVVVDGKPVRLQLCDMAGQVSCTFSLNRTTYSNIYYHT